MPKNEILFSIVGLLGTFMLPWPGEPPRANEKQVEAVPVRATCSEDAAQHLAKRASQRGQGGGA